MECCQEISIVTERTYYKFLFYLSENKAVGIMKPGHSFTIEPMISEGTYILETKFILCKPRVLNRGHCHGHYVDMDKYLN